MNEFARNLNEIKKKYKNHNVEFDVIRNEIILNKPLEVIYLRTFRRECLRLGYKFRIITWKESDFYK